MMHTLDLANFPVTDTLKMLASLLEKITSANDQLKSHNINHTETSPSTVSVASTPSFTRFHARSVPSIDIHSYLSRILKYCPTTNECFLSLLVYFDRMSKNAIATTGKPFSIDSFNIHRLIIAGIMVSSKFFSDVFFTNSRYAKVGGLPVSELNQLELEFLVLNDFRLAITVEELQKYGDQLLKHWVKEEEMRQGAGIYDNIRYPNGHGRWDSGHSFDKSLSKRSRKFPSTDDTTSKGGGSKAMKEEDQIENNHHVIRSHRRDSSFSSTKSLNITSSYQSTLTSSPQQYSTHLSKTPPPPLPGSSPSMVSASNGNGNSINNSPMHAPFASSSVFNAHHPVYHHLHKPYPHHPHHQSQHHRSMSLGSTIKRANSSGSLLSRARSGDLSDDLQQYHHPRHSSPKPMNPEDLAYRTAAAPPYSSAPPTTPTLTIPTSKSINGNRNCPQPSSNNTTLPTPSPTHNITNLMRRMSHDSPSNPFQYPPPSYHYPAYPPAPSTQSLPTTPVTTLPPSLPGLSFNTAAISNAIGGYARRASLALLPLPRHLGGFTSSSIPSPVSTVPPDNLSPGLVRRGSVPAWSGSSISNGNNGSSNGASGLNPESRNSTMGNGSSLSISSVPISSSSLSGKQNTIVNGHGHNHIHTNGVSTTHGTPSAELSKRSSWVVVNNNLSNHGLYNHGQHHNSQNNHLQHNHHLQNHGHGNASRSSSSDSCHSSSTTGSNSGSTASDSGLSTSISVSRMTTNGDENSNINRSNKSREN
ncbi:Pcl7p [Rhizophagus irregularis DAOM 197198w]|uniref:Pcl7p n=6 Tax=Rhizophagus irregularis TaxID=588596 RepID=A0A015JIC0_RHIIW|nr:Pcl7p [Rhizophagus irregularis DAOM 197198w]